MDNLLNKKKERKKKLNCDDYREIIAIPGFDGPLITFKLFKEIQNNNSLSEEDLQLIFDDYKEKYEKKKFDSFYSEHFKEDWFKEKYHPIISLKVRNELIIQTQKISNQFYDNYKSGTYKNIDLSFKNIFYSNFFYEKFNFNDATKENIENKSLVSYTEKNYFTFDSNNNTLFINQLPKNASRLDILNVAKKIPGFFLMSVSEALKSRDFNRFCWLTFDTNENCDKAINYLKDYKIKGEFKLNPIKSQTKSNDKIRISNIIINDENVKIYIDFTDEIIKIFKKRNSIENIDLKIDDKYKNDDFYHLDINLLYLRRVFNFCYFCFETYEDERNLSTKCDCCHLYINKNLNNDEYKNNNEYVENLIKTSKKFIEKFNKNDDNLNKKKLHEEKIREKIFSELFKEVNEKQFDCNLCVKKFKSLQYIKNHTLNKHKEIFEEKVNEKLMKEKFFKDKNNTNYEKIKTISEMDDYYSYLKAMNNYQNNMNRKKKLIEENISNNNNNNKNNEINIDTYDDL